MRVKRIRGPIGSRVTLTLERDGESFDVVIIRDRISINPVVSRINTTASGAQVGYIRLKQFSANAATDMSKVVKDMEAQGVDAYVLDLRFNPGGLLEASVAISDQWLDVDVPIVSIRSGRSQKMRFTRQQPLTDDPLVILVNEVSASASEILSGAIQDNDRGQLVGEQTFGKGLVQSVRKLSDGSGMTVTISKYLTPNGRDIHREGIAPDVESKLSVEELRDLGVDGLGTNKDRQYRVAEGIVLEALVQLAWETRRTSEGRGQQILRVWRRQVASGHRRKSRHRRRSGSRRSQRQRQGSGSNQEGEVDGSEIVQQDSVSCRSVTGLFPSA